jgi:hypothetical protein
MLVRYKGQKVGGCPVKIPVGLKSWALMQKAKTVIINPVADLPDADAVKLCEIDPTNFELAPDEIRPEAVGTELDPDPAPKPKKRGRRSNAQLLALKKAREANA